MREPGQARQHVGQGKEAQVGTLPEPPERCVLPCAPEQGEEERPWPQDLQPPPLPGQEERSDGNERPATEPLLKVLDTPLSEGDEPTTLPAQRAHGPSVQMEGYLGRKHDLEGPNKKASNRCQGRAAGRGERGSFQGSLHQQSLAGERAARGL